MKYPAASSGVSKTHHASDPDSVTPESVYQGSQFQTRLDSHLKTFGNDGLRTQQSAGKETSEIQTARLCRPGKALPPSGRACDTPEGAKVSETAPIDGLFRLD